MLTKKIIKQILSEEVVQPALYDKVGRSALMYYYKQKKVHYEKNNYDPIEPFDDWVESLKNEYPYYADFGHAVQVTSMNSPILDGLETEEKIKILSNYILNHNEGGNIHSVEVTTDDKLSRYEKDQTYKGKLWATFPLDGVKWVIIKK